MLGLLRLVFHRTVCRLGLATWHEVVAYAGVVHRGRRASASLGTIVVGSVALLGACGGDDSGGGTLGPTEWRVAVYETVLRDVALDVARDLAEGDARPVVFLASADGSGIDPDVQVALVGAVKDDIDLRVQDERDEVIVESNEGDAPVRDHGLLVTVGRLPDDRPGRFEVEVVLYEDETHVDTVTAAFTGQPPTWTLSTLTP
jgi:hypothetical protein